MQDPSSKLFYEFSNATRPPTAEERQAIRYAIGILDGLLRQPGACLTSPAEVRDFVTLQIGASAQEIFLGLFLDSQHRLIHSQELFRGTLTQTSVYPREVVKEALRLNAAAVIFAHNHPSGVPDPSQADQALTQTLKQALNLVDVRVIDHVIVGGTQTKTFAELGLL